VAMGATTYAWIVAHGESWPYELPTWVFTHRQLESASEHIRFASGDVAPAHAEMVAAAGGRHRWIVGGGDLAGQFAAAGLLDEVIVYIAPVTLGAGAPLLPRHVELRLEELERNVDFACARYAVVK
jgi:dihydrofolate reductase